MRTIIVGSGQMWDQLPLDLLSHIFSYLAPDALLRATSTCKHWHAAASLHAAPTARHLPWLLAMPTRGRAAACYVYNPASHRWHSVPLDFSCLPLRLVAPLGGLLLCKLASAASLRLAFCNPFARQLRLLPDLHTRRCNPAVGVVPVAGAAGFLVYVAGGTAAGAYEPTLEVFDSREGRWRRPRPMPAEFAVRLTVWTPDEGVHAGGTLYWMTSARAYSVVGLDVGRGAWRELRAPEAERLEWAALVRRSGGRRLGLVGGTCAGECLIWELDDTDGWALVGTVPPEHGERLLCGQRGRCIGVGSDEEEDDHQLYLLRDQLGSDTLVCKEVVVSAADTGGGDEEQQEQRRWEWSYSWVKSCCSSSCLGGGDDEDRMLLSNVPIKAVLLHPTLSSLSCIP